jgi:Ni,Fe-hydrogenase III component G
MTREETLAALRERLGARVKACVTKSPRRIYMDVLPADVPEATRVIFRELGARFQIASGVDTPTGIEILYHWAFDRLDCIVSLRTRLDRDRPEIESLARICKGAEWIEREIAELFGVTFRNHPDMRHLLLKDDWPAGRYPLRRDYGRDAANAPGKPPEDAGRGS